MSPPSPDLPADLRAAADTLGIATAYRDVFGHQHHAGPDAVVAIAGAMLGHAGANAPDVVDGARALADQRTRQWVPAVVVAWQPGPVVVPVRVGPGVGRVTVDVVPDVTSGAAAAGGGSAEQSVTVIPADAAVAVDLGGLGLGPGRHRLVVTCAAGATETRDEATLVVAPTVLPRFDPGRRQWGVFAPVWSAWSPRRPDVHLGQLDAVGQWAAGHGAALVGTLPMLATFLDHPADPSPYSPVSRRWWNEALVDPAACPGAGARGGATPTVGVMPTGGGPAGVATSDPAAPWDPVAHWAALRPVLAELADRAWADPGLRGQLLQWVAANPDARAYAGFRATMDRTGTSWHQWSVADHRRAREGNPDDGTVLAWLYAQWAMAGQLDGLTEAMAARGQQLYLDLALGSHGDGFDTWQSPESFGWGVAVGAPPDELFTGGQNWGFPPVLPHVASATGHGELAASLAAHMAVCGVLRLDHVMGFQRLFWIPDGAAAADGVYVAQPLEEMLAVLSVEAWRTGTVVVGENLGTVDAGVEQAMERHGLFGMYVGQFEVPDAPGAPMAEPAADDLAALNTHDTPTFAGWLAAEDIDRRAAMGLLDAAGVRTGHARRQAQVAQLVERLGGPRSELLARLLAWLGASDAAMVLVSIDDLVGATEPQNVPGTPAARPNWVLRLPMSLEELAADDTVSATLDGLNHQRMQDR